MNDNEWSLKKREEMNMVGGYDKQLVGTAWKRVFDLFKEHLKTV